MVVFEGVRYQGRHQPLISMELFEEVAALKASRRPSKEKPYQHPHYLKGTVACGQCGDRLGVTKVTNRHGQKYDYFYCLGRQKHRSDCTQTYVAMDLVEDRVADLWQSVVLPADVRGALRRAVLDLAERTQTEQSAEIGRCTARLARLDAEREKLLQAHYAEAVPLDLLKREQARIGKEMAAAQATLGRLNTELGAVEEGLDQALALVADCHQLYLEAPAHIRRQLNQAVFEQILIDDGEVPTGRLAAPFGELLELIEQAEVKEWGSEDQLKRYLRRDPREPTSIQEIEATIARILSGNEERAVLVDGPGKNKNPGPHVLGQGLNVALLRRGGFEPSAGGCPATVSRRRPCQARQRYPSRVLRPGAPRARHCARQAGSPAAQEEGGKSTVGSTMSAKCWRRSMIITSYVAMKSSLPHRTEFALSTNIGSRGNWRCSPETEAVKGAGARQVFSEPPTCVASGCGIRSWKA